MYNGLYSYIVYCVLTNFTSSGICNQRWIYGIIKYWIELNSKVWKPQWKFELLNPSHGKAHLVCASQLLPATQHVFIINSVCCWEKRNHFLDKMCSFSLLPALPMLTIVVSSCKQEMVTFLSKCSDKASNKIVALASKI